VTTERILPAIALPAPARHRPVAVPAGRTEVRPHPAKRKEALLTMPARAGMLVGASAAVYAVSLAGVAALQTTADADLAASRQPYLEAVAETRAANDDLEATLATLAARANELAASYGDTSDAIAAYQARLDQLAALVADVQGSAAALPTRLSLPKVTARASVRSTRAPATTAKTGASGH
jgi:hypothetical protein